MLEEQSTLAALCVLAGFKYSVLLSGYRNIPKKAKKAGKVSAIWYFPVKSCHGIQLQEAHCTQEGIRPKDSAIIDRHLCVYDPERECFITQRQEPTMSLVKTSLNSGGKLQLDAPGQGPLVVELPTKGRVIHCKIFKDTQACFDCGPEAERWLTNYLGGRRRCLAFAADHLPKRAESKLTTGVGPLYTAPHEKVAFAGYASYLLATETSLEELNGRLAKPVTMDNFRPNIVVSNKTAFDEDNWQEVYINNVRFRKVKPCERCIMTTVDHEKGKKREDEEPLKTLKTYRIKPEVSKHAPIFGADLFADLTGDISVGDDIFVIYND